MVQIHEKNAISKKFVHGHILISFGIEFFSHNHTNNAVGCKFIPKSHEKFPFLWHFENQ